MTARSAKSGAKPGAKPTAHRVCGGIFTPDQTVPGDPITGQQVCRCGLLGEPGDAHHTLPDRPAEADARERAAGESAGAE